LPKIEEDGKSWLIGPKLYKRVVEPHKKKNALLIYQEAQFEITTWFPIKTMITATHISY
jgi:hypothetical protein